jgi:hypothetical protein
MDNKDIKTFGMLILGLFLVGVITGVTYIGFDYLKSNACTIGDDSYVWRAGDCYNDSTATAADGTAQTLTSITKIEVVEGVVNTALALLALVVIMAIFKLVIKTARGFGSGM